MGQEAGSDLTGRDPAGKGPGSVKCREIQKAAEPVRDMANRVMELLPETRAGRVFVKEKLRGADLCKLDPGTTLRCKDITVLRDGLVAELGEGGERAEQIGASEGGSEVVSLIDKLRTQFAAVREYHERVKGPVDFDFFVQQYDEMMGGGIYPDLAVFNMWEERACRVYDEYDGVLTRMTDCGHVAGIRFLSLMLGACSTVGQVKRVISYVDNSDCGLRDHLLGVFAKWIRMNAVGCGEVGCKSLREFFDELVEASGGVTSPWSFYRMALEQNIKTAHENVPRKNRRWKAAGRGGRDGQSGRGGSPGRNDWKGGWGSRRVGDPKPQGKPVEVIVKGEGVVRKI